MDVITIGESMVLFHPEKEGFMRYSDKFSKKIGGAESNFAIGLRRLGHSVSWIGRLGNDEFGKSIMSFLKGEDVDISHVIIDEKHSTGIYFKEKRTISNVKVHYYRENSAGSKLSPTDISPEYFNNVKFLFLTGITLALSEDCYQSVYKAIQIAKEKSVKVIFDPNIRHKLWKNKNAKNELSKIMNMSDIVLIGLDEARYLFDNFEYKVLADNILRYEPKIVVIKDGAKGTYFKTENESGFVPSFEVQNVVDPVGAGDGFNAGFIAGLLKNKTLEESVKIGNAVGANVVSIDGDVEGLPEIEDLEQYLSKSSKDVNR